MWYILYGISHERDNNDIEPQLVVDYSLLFR